MSGVVTLSVELELGWGKHDLGEFSHLSPDRSTEEVTLRRLLRSCASGTIPISFDVVGHLFHESCPGYHEGPYPRSWWEHDPGSTRESHPQFYAPDLIRAIDESPVEHEICTHTYSHILAEETSADLLAHELELVRDIHREWGIEPPSSIVLPRHQAADRSVLKQYGIRTVRRPDRSHGIPDTTAVRKWLWVLRSDHPECEITERDGIYETTCTPFPSLSGITLPSGQSQAPSYFRVIPQRIRERMHSRYLVRAVEMAAETGSHVHLWTHLHNMANESQWRAISPALERLGELHEQGRVDVRPMRDLPAVE